MAAALTLPLREVCFTPNLIGSGSLSQRLTVVRVGERWQKVAAIVRNRMVGVPEYLLSAGKEVVVRVDWANQNGRNERHEFISIMSYNEAQRS